MGVFDKRFYYLAIQLQQDVHKKLNFATLYICITDDIMIANLLYNSAINYCPGTIEYSYNSLDIFILYLLNVSHFKLRKSVIGNMKKLKIGTFYPPSKNVYCYVLIMRIIVFTQSFFYPLGSVSEVFVNRDFDFKLN